MIVSSIAIANTVSLSSFKFQVSHNATTVGSLRMERFVVNVVYIIIILHSCFAFGNVNRKRLLYKIRKNFGISGKLFSYIQIFLTDRYARLNITNTEDDWFHSIFDTSAGTSLGPLLFILNMHDVPKCILPKFADDLVAFSVCSDMRSTKEKLQQLVELEEWADKEGMELNVSKTKVMVFGSHKENLDIKINGIVVEQVDSYKYLGIVLDSELNFSMQTDYRVKQKELQLTFLDL